jgi:selenocysteine lyase/cysteine desulfurase
VYARIHELASQVRERVARYPQLSITNASADRFYGGLVTFEPNQGKGKLDLKPVMDQCASRNIRIAGGPDHIRISTHIFTQPAELDTFYTALEAGLA